MADPTNYALQAYNSVVTTFTGTAEPSAAPNTTDSWRSESPLTGGFAAGNWTIALSVIASVANASGTGVIRVRIWKSANADGSSATELTTSTVSTSPWGNLTTATAQNLTATVSIPQTNFVNEYLFIQTAIQIDTASASSTAEVRFRIDGTNSRITTSSFSQAINGDQIYLDGYSEDINREVYLSSDSSSEDIYVSGVNRQVYLTATNESDPIYNSDINPSRSVIAEINIPGPEGTAQIYYLMRAVDPDCPTLTYVSWVVQGQPDTTGSQYTGPKCGGSPLQEITIASRWIIE